MATLDPGPVAVLGLSLFALLPLARPHFVGAHDALLTLYKALEFEGALRESSPFPRWAPDFFFGYGYPLFQFQAPLAFYLALPFRVLGASVGSAVELTFALGFLLSGLTMYWFARDLLPRWGAVTAAVAYVYFPYHLVDAHFRGGLPEFLALAWFPALLWAAGRSLLRQSLGYALVSALLYAALILTHNVMALLFSPFLLAYGLLLALAHGWGPRGRFLVKRFWLLLLLTLLGQGLAAFFWLPALAELDTVQSQNLYADPTVDYRHNFPRELFSPELLQSYGRRTETTYGYPIQVGLIQGLLGLVGGIVGVLSWWSGPHPSRVAQATQPEIQGPGLPLSPGFVLGFFWGCTLVSLFFMVPASLFVWDALPLMAFVQFPWRFLGPLGLFTSVLIGMVWGLRGEPKESPVALVFRSGLSGRPWGRALLPYGVLALIVLSASWKLSPRLMDLRPEDESVAGSLRLEILTQSIGTTSLGEYLPRAVQQRPLTSSLALEYLLTGRRPVLRQHPQDAQVVEEVARSTEYRVRLVLANPGPVIFNVPYWEGWRAYLDDQPVPIEPWGALGLIGVAVPQGPHTVRVSLESTPVRTAAVLVSGVSALLWLALLLEGLALGLLWLRQPRPRTNPTPGLSPGQPSLWGIALASLGLFSVFLALGRPQNPAGAQYPLMVRLGEVVEVLGYDLLAGPDLSQELRGNLSSAHLTLYWRPLRALKRDYHTFLHLSNATDQVWAQFDRRAGPSGYPTSRWKPGEIVADRYEVRVPLGVPAGLYLLKVGLYDPQSLARLPITAEELTRPFLPKHVLELGPLLVGRSPRWEKEPQYPLARSLGPLPLLGFDLGDPGEEQTLPALARGAILPVVLYWRPQTPIKADYTVFLHLEDNQQRVWAQTDQAPGRGTYPTSLWQPGEALLDRYELKIPDDLPPGAYRLTLGAYDPLTGQRLPVMGEAPDTDFVVLAQLRLGEVGR